MAGRNELAYDEDDYVPPGYVPPKPAGGRSKSLVALVIVGLIVGAFVVLFLMRNRDRARFARMEMMRAQQAAAGKANRFEARPTIRGAIDEEETETSHLVSRLVGVWARNPEPERVTSYPYRLQFHTDQSGTITEFDPATGKVRELDVGIRIRSELDGTLIMRLTYIENGATRVSDYPFRMTPDDTLVMHDETGSLVFRRQK